MIPSKRLYKILIINLYKSNLYKISNKDKIKNTKYLELIWNENCE